MKVQFLHHRRQFLGGGLAVAAAAALPLHSLAATGLTAVAIQTGVPCTFGVLTCETMDQAIARSGGDKGNAGADAADAAVAMANLVAEGR